MWLRHFQFHLVPNIGVQRFVLVLLSEASTVHIHILRVDHTLMGSLADLTKQSSPLSLGVGEYHFLVWITPLSELWISDHLRVVGRCSAYAVYYIVLL